MLNLPDTVRFTDLKRRRLPIELSDTTGEAVEPNFLSAEVSGETVVGAWDGRPTEGLDLYPIGNGAAMVVVTAGRYSAMGVDTIHVEVQVEPDALDLPRMPGGILVDGEYPLPLTVRSDGGAFFPVQPPASIQRQASWRSSDPAVAVVDGEGNVTGIGPGEVVITAVWEGLQADLPLLVSRPIELATEGYPAPATAGPGIAALTASPDGRLYYLLRHYRTYEIFGLDPAGSITWSERLSGEAGQIRTAPDGTLHYLDHGIHARKPDGTLIWRNANCEHSSILSVGSAGLYCWNGGQVDAISENGEKLWSFAASAVAAVNPSNPERVYLAGGELTALDLAGTVIWTSPLPGRARKIVLGGTGTIFVSLQDGGVAAFDSNGRSVWYNPDFGGPVGVTQDGDVIARSSSKSVFARLDGSSGLVDWTVVHPAGAIQRPVLAIGRDGTRLFVVGSYHIFAFDLATGASVGRSAEELPYAYNAAAAGAHLFIGGYTGVAKVTLPTEVDLFD